MVAREQKGTEIAQVVELGPTAYKAFDDGEPWCKAGDYVKIQRYSGEDTEIDGEFYRTINDNEVIALLKVEIQE